MADNSKAKTIAELRESGYEVVPVKNEVRRNLIKKIEAGEEMFPDIIGFDESVIPQLENAILAGQDLILLGERGQAKSRLIRNIVTLLDEEIPAIAGCELNDDPFDPICKSCQVRVAKHGDDVDIRWIPREERFSEKLATPDITVADLIGEIDPIKVAEGRYLSDELTIHYGLIPRTNRGIFCINELPDLSERIQVSLFNLMQERDIQIKGYQIMLPLDVFLVCSANPEDYTNRGRIVTPLKDRYGAQIRTHYPRSLEEEIDIVEQEHSRFPDTMEVVSVPQYMKEVIAEFTALARRSPEINQRSGVSLRVSIANYETIVGNAFKRSLRLREKAAPRVSDLPAIVASTTGKVEMESVEEGREYKVVDDLIKKAVLNTFGRYFNPREFIDVLARFEEGLVIETGADVQSDAYTTKLPQLANLQEMVDRIEPSDDPASVASAIELILEGLHLNRRLNRDQSGGTYVYSS
ncbi:MAG: sigma 54-interacting transcriptional regulator [SAR202 cluster bacterium]|jgi:magnesium chelatase subunit I|nr:sigma 54-interacting transcriptional regulator [SAR202 cluster bacterium]MDP7103366.1 sigma 54-interacting transcriptional regulator [SAR202 cluster bacterium]MDP7223770.1 sigma 54-interacting transcriptional regulator [SAR202 cluster bacterium]MDP7415043.1 sigma 54-interacting transcriptional regulator [SAR202 cluster bacterium]HJO81734.1 sigma 54-interacting transcriptional regulator [SAR202 cluster bacterium]|tara:strand:- start:334 stop:1734 length:1401 start_codon:yes stop_codon:yes gene_type:complete